MLRDEIIEEYNKYNQVTTNENKEKEYEKKAEELWKIIQQLFQNQKIPFLSADIHFQTENPNQSLYWPYYKYVEEELAKIAISEGLDLIWCKKHDGNQFIPVYRNGKLVMEKTNVKIPEIFKQIKKDVGEEFTPFIEISVIDYYANYILNVINLYERYNVRDHKSCEDSDYNEIIAAYSNLADQKFFSRERSWYQKLEKYCNPELDLKYFFEICHGDSFFNRRLRYESSEDFDIFRNAAYRMGYENNELAIAPTYAEHIKYRESYGDVLFQRIRNCVEISHILNKQKMQEKYKKRELIK